MTVGIAAHGPGAGRAVLLGLRAVESVGSGAIGGFVAFAGVDASQVYRLETQRGGTDGLFGQAGLDALAPDIAALRCAGLISSGPDRPEPLSQFLAAAAGVGLVTGHRLPNAPSDDGRPFNARLLEAMRAGESPQDAVPSALAREPTLDAGIIALGIDGAHASGDTALVAARGDLGRAVRLGSASSRDDDVRKTSGPSADGPTVALVLHNAIEPHDSLAALVADIVSNAMCRPRVITHVTISAGIPLRAGSASALRVDAHDRVLGVDVCDASMLCGERHLGLGDRVPVLGPDGGARGLLGREPLLVCRDARLESIDGRETDELPVVAERL